VLIVLINRDGEVIVPRGETVVRSGDTLMVLADLAGLAEVRRQVNGS
jgi:Trk K+ transport system NAD-binding subunit